MKDLYSKKSILVGAVSLAAMAAGINAAHAQETAFDIEAQPLAKALLEFNEQSGLTVAAPRDLVAGKSSLAVRGDMEPRAALNLMLADTGLSPTELTTGAYAIRVSAQESEPQPVAPASAAPQQEDDSGDEDVEIEPVVDDVRRESTIIVTGTNLRGVNDQFAPATSLSREDIDFQGLQNVSDLIDKLPQNFGGIVGLDNGSGDNANGAGAVGINLRGLGVEATLVLINGRRVAAGGARGNFVDVSAIPVGAIDRVEVVTDGASAIYGSDAIAGVVNFILRDDYNGAESSISYDGATDGGAGSLRVSHTAGFSNDTSNGLVTYQYTNTEPLDAADKDFTESAARPSWLTPQTEAHALFASGGIDLSERLSASADAYYNKRTTQQFASIDVGFVITTFSDVESEQYGLTGGLEYEISDNWTAELIGTFSKSELTADTDNFAFNGVVNRPSTYENYSIDAVLNGDLPSFSSEPSKLAIGAHYRSEDIDSFIFFDSPSFGSFFTEQTDQGREVAAVFAEYYSPLITEASDVPWAERLAVTLAVRAEDYDDVGSSTNPRLGILWSPTDGLSFRSTYGTSFRAPALFRLNNDYQAFLGRYRDPLAADMNTPAIELRGSTDDLEPEESESWSIGFDWTPPQIEGFSLGATYFDIEYDGRIGSARSITTPDGFFSDFTGTPIRMPSLDVLQSLAAGATQVVDLADVVMSAPPRTPLEDVEVILDRRLINLSSSNVSGIDVNASYSRPLWNGNVSASVNGTFLDALDEQVAPALPSQDLLDTIGEPASVRIRGGIQWSNQALSTGLFVNHTGGYDDNRGPDPFSIDAWTTFDASLQLELGELISSNWLSDTRLGVTVRNIANEDPPEILLGIPFDTRLFDSTNADPYGRRMGISLTKIW